MEFGHLLTCSGLKCPEVSLEFYHDSLEEIPSQNMPVQRLKVAILPPDLPCSGPVTLSEEILTTGRSHGKKLDRFS